MIETQRLLLRAWREDDKPRFAQLGQDDEVMRYMPKKLTRQESDALANKAQSLITQHGYGFWAVEEKSSNLFIGFVGLHRQPEDSGIPFSPMLEVGWRLHRDAWGKGYATEAAKAALEYGFTALNEANIYAFTTLKNQRSQSVMNRLGMINCRQDFDHPKIEPNHPIVRHCIYGLSKEAWLASL